MSDRKAQAWTGRPEATDAAEATAAGFAAGTEALRRDGRFVEAERVVRSGLERAPGSLEGRLLLALTLLDQGKVDDARNALAEALVGLRTSAPETRAKAAPTATDGDWSDEVTDGELESAFDAAEPVLDELVDADRVAELALREAELDQPEDFDSFSADPVFATRTMAEVLERQGDGAGASRIRASLGLGTREAPDVFARTAEDDRQRVVTTLESWLNNLRSGAQ